MRGESKLQFEARGEVQPTFQARARRRRRSCVKHFVSAQPKTNATVGPRNHWPWPPDMGPYRIIIKEFDPYFNQKPAASADLCC